MTTKEQERKALEQIRKIVEGLGENSYIGTAFEGCFEIAEQNIDNDFGCSMKQRAESAEKKAEEFRRAADYEGAETERARSEAEKAVVENEQLKRQLEMARQLAHNTEAETIELQKIVRETESKLKAAEEQIIRLKARLFDLIDEEVS